MSFIRSIPFYGLAFTLAISASSLNAQEESNKSPKRGEVETTEEGLLANPGERAKTLSPMAINKMENSLEELQERLNNRMERLKGEAIAVERKTLMDEQRQDLMAHLALLDAIEMEEKTSWTLEEVRDHMAELEARMQQIESAEVDARAQLLEDQMSAMRLHLRMMESLQSQFDLKSGE